VSDYRFYYLVADRIVEHASYECTDDEAAYSKAAAILLTTSPRSCEAVEVWQKARLVGVVHRDAIRAAD
jgi:hypothetical protein